MLGWYTIYVRWCSTDARWCLVLPDCGSWKSHHWTSSVSYIWALFLLSNPTGNICSSVPCLNGGTCLVAGDRYFCICLSDYIGTECQMFNRKFSAVSICRIDIECWLPFVSIDSHIQPYSVLLLLLEWLVQSTNFHLLQTSEKRRIL